MLKRKVALLLALLTMVVQAGCNTMKQSKSDSAAKVNVQVEDFLADQAQVDSNLKKEVEARYSLDDAFVAVNPYGNAPLSAVAIFRTENETGVNLRVKGHDESTDIVKDFPKATDHVIPIYGLYPGEENDVILTLDDGKSKELQIQTDKVDSPFTNTKILKKPVKGMVAEGLIFATPSGLGADKVSAVAYDQKGDLRWIVYGGASAYSIRRASDGNLLISSLRLLSSPYFTMGVRKMDLMGKTYKEYILPGGQHHDVRELDNGNLLVVSGGYKEATNEDISYEIDGESGEVIREIDFKNILPQDDGGSLVTTPHDWFHQNAIWYDKDSNTIINSARNINAVVAIDYDTLELRWILGDPKDWKQVDKKYFFTPVGKNFEWQFAQHASFFTPEGELVLFDNGNERATKSNESDRLDADHNYSRAVSYKIDTEKMTIEQLWQFGKERGSKWFSNSVSDVDYLGKDHYLFNSGAISYDPVKKTHVTSFGDPNVIRTSSIVEYNKNKVVYELEVGVGIYRAEKMHLYTNEGNNFDLFAEGVQVGKLADEKLEDVTAPEGEAKTPDFFTVDAIQTRELVKVNGTWDAGKAPKEAKLVIKDASGKYSGVTIDPPRVFDPRPGDPTPEPAPIDFLSQISTSTLDGIYELYILADGVLYDIGKAFEVK